MNELGVSLYFAYVLAQNGGRGETGHPFLRPWIRPWILPSKCVKVFVCLRVLHILGTIMYSMYTLFTWRVEVSALRLFLFL